jgi:hypothetical protein
MSADEIRVETDLSYLLEDIATELQLTAGDLRKLPFVCLEERLTRISIMLAQSMFAGYKIALGNPRIAQCLIERIRESHDLNGSAADAASESRQAQQRVK